MMPVTDRELRVALLLGLDLLQGVQQHRGLGGQTSSEARQNCQALGNHVDRLWQQWPEATQRQDWQALRARPDSFDGHCRLLQALLGTLQELELRRCALTLQAPQLAERCWALEDLGLLRGLSVRAAAHEHCPLAMLIQLQYLHERLAQNSPRALADALQRLQRDLLKAAPIRISARECYGLLTPLIDERLDGIRANLT
jgi:hypothetical protein